MNSFFESVSGFTTTGFSLITDPDGLPRSLMFYRSFTHLIGGLGVVFILLVLLSIVLVAATGALLSFSGFGLIDSVFEAVSAFTTTGLSVEIVSVALAIHLKLTLIILMVIGRVEILPFLIAVTKIRGWKRTPENNGLSQ